MDDYWLQTEEAEEPYEEPAYEEGGRPGCVSVFAVLLAAAGIVYSATLGIAGLNLVADGGGRPGAGAALGLLAAGGLLLSVIVAVGLWRMRMWAWWLTVLGQSLAIAAGLLSFGAAFLASDPAGALGFVLTPLMGLTAGGVILYWFVANRYRFGEGGAADAGGREGSEPAADRTLVVAAVAVIAVIGILCLAGALVALVFVLGFRAPFF